MSYSPAFSQINAGFSIVSYCKRLNFSWCRQIFHWVCLVLGSDTIRAVICQFVYISKPEDNSWQPTELEGLKPSTPNFKKKKNKSQWFQPSPTIQVLQATLHCTNSIPLIYACKYLQFGGHQHKNSCAQNTGYVSYNSQFLFVVVVGICFAFVPRNKFVISNTSTFYKYEYLQYNRPNR